MGQTTQTRGQNTNWSVQDLLSMKEHSRFLTRLRLVLLKHGLKHSSPLLCAVYLKWEEQKRGERECVCVCVCKREQEGERENKRVRERE